MDTVAKASQSWVRNDAAPSSVSATFATSSGEEERIGHGSCRGSSGDLASLPTPETTMNTSSESRTEKARFELHYRRVFAFFNEELVPD